MTRLTRKLLSMNWTYAVGEVVLIVIGVSIALGVNAWYQYRLDRISESQYLCRLYEDISEDSRLLGRFSERLEVKARTLTLLLTETDETFLSRPLAQISDELGASDTVSLPTIHTSTFDELRSTGNLSLVRNADIRTGFADYYRTYQLFFRILAEPIGPYKRILAGSVPGDAEFDRRVNGVPLNRSNLVEGLDALRSHPEFERAVNAELSYAAGLLDRTRQFRADALALVESIADELATRPYRSNLSAECKIL